MRQSLMSAAAEFATSSFKSSRLFSAITFSSLERASDHGLTASQLHDVVVFANSGDDDVTDSCVTVVGTRLTAANSHGSANTRPNGGADRRPKTLVASDAIVDGQQLQTEARLRPT
jgi:hypothetical protein